MKKSSGMVHLKNFNGIGNPETNALKIPFSHKLWARF